MSAAEDYPMIAGLKGVTPPDVAEEAQMVLAELDVIRAKVNLLEAELAATEVALRIAGYDGALTR